MPAGSKQAGVRGAVPDTPKGTSVSLYHLYLHHRGRPVGFPEGRSSKVSYASEAAEYTPPPFVGSPITGFVKVYCSMNTGCCDAALVSSASGASGELIVVICETRGHQRFK